MRTTPNVKTSAPLPAEGSASERANGEAGRGLGAAPCSEYVVKSVAFEGPKSGPDRGYTVRASYLKEPHAGDALVEIFKDGQPLRQFTFPAYKIWNIAAHFKDIVDGEIEKSASGYAMAASDGLGGYAPMTPVNTPNDQALRRGEETP